MERSAEKLYCVGYQFRNDKDTLFPYNRRMCLAFGAPQNLIVSDRSVSLDYCSIYLEYLKSKNVPFHIKALT
jgi:hypothetical protein